MTSGPMSLIDTDEVTVNDKDYGKKVTMITKLKDYMNSL
jgi:hypothetical protein